MAFTGITSIEIPIQQAGSPSLQQFWRFVESADDFRDNPASRQPLSSTPIQTVQANAAISDNPASRQPLSSTAFAVSGSACVKPVTIQQAGSPSLQRACRFPPDHSRGR